MIRPAFARVLAAWVAAPAATQPRLHLPGKGASDRTILLSADVACSPDRAYAMWTDQDRVRAFFAPSARIEPRPGGAYTIAFFPSEDPEGRVHGTRGAHVLLAEPGRFLAFEWVVFAGDRNKGANAPPYAPATMRLPKPLPTWVELAFVPGGTGTRIAFRHYGFGEGPLWGRSQAWFTRAWAGVLDRMEAACARG
jgi:uncharacterized protein YndB with AHSA1/START domain